MCCRRVSNIDELIRGIFCPSFETSQPASDTFTITKLSKDTHNNIVDRLEIHSVIPFTPIALTRIHYYTFCIHEKQTIYLAKFARQK